MSINKHQCEIPGCPNEYYKLLRYQLPNETEQSQILVCYSCYYKYFRESLTGGNRINGILTRNKQGLACKYEIITITTSGKQYKMAAGRGGRKTSLVEGRK